MHSQTQSKYLKASIPLVPDRCWFWQEKKIFQNFNKQTNKLINKISSSAGLENYCVQITFPDPAEIYELK